MPKHATPLLDQLESGPWPSFVSDIKQEAAAREAKKRREEEDKRRKEEEKRRKEEEEKKIKELLQIPDNKRIRLVIAIGYGSQKKQLSKRKALKDILTIHELL